MFRCLEGEQKARRSDSMMTSSLSEFFATNLIALSDDSGLCINDLDFQPGVHSARFAINQNGQKDFNMAMEKIFSQLADKKIFPKDRPSAFFICNLCLYNPRDNFYINFEGRVDGHLAYPARGTNGFGYDPIFIKDGMSQTFGEITHSFKESISHRAMAFLKLENWLKKGYQGEMHYMNNHFDLRIDPTKLVPGAKSVITLLYNYFPASTQDKSAPKIAKYAWGDDYHQVIKEKLFAMMDEIRIHIPHFEGRAFVDSAPVMERQWAERAGLGWIGKNSLLLRKGVGSFFFLAEIICNVDIEPDAQQTDHCGECRACIDACPTQAIVHPQVIDSNRCISYLTIEDKSWPTDTNNHSKDLKSLNTGEWAYGCDVCQDVCPWNRFSQPHQEPRFEPREMIHWNAEAWKNALLEPARIKTQLKNSAMQRAGLKKLLPQITSALNPRKD